MTGTFAAIAGTSYTKAGMPSSGSIAPFALQASVSRNVIELRRVLGSATRPLSLADLARLLNQRGAGRSRSASLVQRWERGESEPDIESIRLMADLAGVSFENFALGTLHGPRRPRAYKGPEKPMSEALKDMGLRADGTPDTTPAPTTTDRRRRAKGA
jgi:transcriptional regulator with XRE-family HTH domain